jgi:hypothetical protein
MFFLRETELWLQYPSCVAERCGFCCGWGWFQRTSVLYTTGMTHLKKSLRGFLLNIYELFQFQLNLYWPMLTTILHNGYMRCCALVDRNWPNIALKNASNTLWKEKGKKKSRRCSFSCPRLGALWGAERVVPSILNLGARWRRVVSFTPRPPYTWERIPVPIEWKAYVISYTFLSQTWQFSRWLNKGGAVCTLSSFCAWQAAVAFRIRTEVIEYLAVDNMGKKLVKPVELDTEDDAYLAVDTEINGIKCKFLPQLTCLRVCEYIGKC